MGKVFRQYTIKKQRLTPENLRRSLDGAAARAKDGVVCVMVSVPKGVRVPRKLDCLSRLRNEGCLFDLMGVEIDASGRLTGWGLTRPEQYDADGYRHVECFSVLPAAISDCMVSYVEKAA
ncbi:MAG: hypothetical protein ACYC6G_19000 [Desulfobaccales bacterium]